MPTTTETLSPIQLLNARIVAKKGEAKTRLDQLRRQRAAFEKTSASIPPDAGPAEGARLETEWQDERDRLRRAERNFSDVAVLMELDDERGSKSLLVKTVAFLKAQAAQVEQQAAAAKVEQPAGRHLFQADDGIPPQAAPAPHQVPRGGLFGVPDLKPIADELAAFEAEVKAFPDRLPFYKVADMANSIASRLHQAAPPPPPAPRFDKPFLAAR